MDYKIHIITKNINFESDIGNHKISSFGDFDSFDAYDFNIIDLNHSDIMEFDESKNEFSFKKDFITINNSISNMNMENKIIFLLPQNIKTKLLKTRWASPTEKIVIKDRTDLILNLLSSYFNLGNIDLIFDKDKTRICDGFLVSDFSLKSEGDNDVITNNIHEKITTVQSNNIFLTTLKFDTTENIIDFLLETKLIIKKNHVPEWFDELIFYNDNEQFETINREKTIIKNSKLKIKKSKEILERNNHFKSILYANSDELVGVVFEILEEILACDLSDFEDKRKEDFLINLEDNHVLIGEIKGVTSNIRFEHIGQVEQHYRRYLDNNPQYKNEIIKQVLIINYERKKKPGERHEIHDDQIKLAKRNGCLIIDTCTLLKIHKSYLNGDIETNKLKQYIFSESGLCNSDELLEI